jgi:hypothetical protein
MRPKPNLIGQKFGRLKVLTEAPRHPGKVKKWRCLCDCGTQKDVATYQLISGRTQSCGCIRREQMIKRNTIHGKTNTQVYTSWSGIIQRCNNPKNHKYPLYGGRGITVCETWLNFANFLQDMGEPPTSNHSIDRIDVNQGYFPENCRWATIKEQSRNRRDCHYIEYNGEVKTLTDWAELAGIPRYTLHDRLKRGWTIEKSLTAPVRPTRVPLEWDGKCYTLKQWEQVTGINQNALYSRIYTRGWSLEKAFTTPMETIYRPHQKNVQ